MCKIQEPEFHMKETPIWMIFNLTRKDIFEDENSVECFILLNSTFNMYDG